MDAEPPPKDEDLRIGDNAHIAGDVFTGGKRVINTGGGSYIERADSVTIVNQPAAPALGWADVRQYSQKQTERSFASLRTFISAVYVPRRLVENELSSFLLGPKAACVLLGASGSGKTSLLCNWAHALLAAGQAVFFYDCGGSLGADVEREVARDLALAEPGQLVQQLDQISRVAAGEGRQFILIFDAINEFRSSAREGIEDLLKNIDALVKQLPDAGVRLLFGCNATAWDQLQRREATRLFWGRYYDADEACLQLDAFSQDELEAAYARYQAYFHLTSPLADVPAALREQLRNPLLLRLLAEAYQDKDEPITHRALALNVFERYFDERVKRRQDQAFVNELAAEMLRQKNSTLLLSELEANPRLGPEILREEATSSYYYLLDTGILTETSSSDPAASITVKFTYTLVGAYAMARYLLRQPGPAADTVLNLLGQARDFPLAWTAARTLLILRKDSGALAALAQSADLELRELTVQSLVDLQADEPKTADALIEQLLQTDSADVRRTALKAAHYIGSAACHHFLNAAIKGPPDLRSLARDTLYLIGQTDPDFAFGVLDNLADKIGLGAWSELDAILAFVVDLSITLYINHPERETMIQRTSDLWYKVLKERLHLDLLEVRVLGPAFERLLLQAVARGYSGRLVETLTEFIPAELLFNLAPDDQACYKRLVPLVDPQTALGPAAGDVAALLQSDIMLFNLLAAVVLVVHAYHDFPATEPLLSSQFEAMPPGGKLFLLLAFSLLLPDAPTAWTGLLEEWTRRLFKEQPAIVYGTAPSILAQLDLLLVPLGLAYAKRGAGMPLFEELIRGGLERGDPRQVERCLLGLGPVGFYYPQALFDTLRAAITKFDDPSLQPALVRCLATVRTLHVDAVDLFLSQIGADESFQRQVAAAADVELVRRYIYGLGIYNTTVHQGLFYPKMRRQLLMGSLNALVDSRSPQDFMARYSLVPIRMAREAGYRLREWTLPE